MPPEAEPAEVTHPVPPSGSDASISNELARCALPSLIGGFVWAGFGLVSGLSIADFVLLGCAAGVSLFLASATLFGWRHDSRSNHDQLSFGVTWSALGAAALASAGLGAVLQTSTNHRPLGAVTWVCLTGAAALVAVVLTSRLRPSARVGLVAMGVVLTALAAIAAPAISGRVWLEAAVGATLLAGVVFARGAIKPALERIWWGPVGLLALGSVASVAVGATPRLHEAAPLVAGVVGLLH